MKRINQGIKEIFVLILLCVVVFCAFPNYGWEVVMGDDLIAITGMANDGFWGTIFNPINFSLGKVRPVSTVVLYIVYMFCGLNYAKYCIINKILLGIVAFLLYKITVKCGLKNIFAFACSILLITTPFATYGVMQMIGICEILSVALCIMCYYYTYKLIDERSVAGFRKITILWTVFFALLIFNAERFMYLVAIVAFVILLKREIKVFDKIINIGITCLPILLRTIIIVSQGGSSLNTGRGENASLFSNLVTYAGRGAINLFGFPIGQQWHGGFEYLSLPWWVIILGCILLFIVLGVFYANIVCWIKYQNSNSMAVCISMLYCFSSLFSYALVGETHGEDRFLWISYMFMWNGVFLNFSELEDKLLKRIIVICVIPYLFLNRYYVDNKVRAHFRYSQEIAQTAYEGITEKMKEREVSEVYCINTNDYNWVFYEGTFFEFYFDGITAYFYNSLDEVDRTQVGENALLLYPDGNNEIPYGTNVEWFTEESVIE